MGSKRRKSNTRSRTHALREYTFFIERPLDSPTFADALTSEGVRAERFFSHGLRPDANDGEWIRYAASRQWVSLTADRQLGSTPDEIADIMESGARVFAFAYRKGVCHPLLAENFLRMAAKIARFLKKHDGPFIAKINRPNQRDWDLGRPGTIRMYRTYEDWLENRHRSRY